MVEHPHYRYRFIEKSKTLISSVLSGMREKDERELAPFSFLEEAGEEIRNRLDHAVEQTKRLVILLMAGSLVLFLLLTLLGRKPSDPDLFALRPAPGEDPAAREVLLQLSYGNAAIEQEVRLDLPPREWSRSEADALFDRCEQEIREQLTDALLVLRGDLALPFVSRDGLVAISWNSSDPSRIDEEGKVDLIGAESGDPVTLTAVLSVGEHVRRLELQAFPDPGEEADWDSSLRNEAASLVKGLPALLGETKLDLPSQSPLGATARWIVPKQALPWEISGLCLFLCLTAVFCRTDGIKRRLKRQKHLFEQEIPNMVMQMILLLDAGLTVEVAFERLIKENREQENPLYRSFNRLEAESRATNMPFVNLLYVYARQSGIRDLIRFASLALDCSGRGSELAEKLDRERQQLWGNRLNAARAKGKEAETKLSLPLMFLLLVLVVIAISPALLEM